VTFHLSAWNRGSLAPEEGEAARRLMAAHGFSRLFVLHGNALLVGQEAVLLVGPAGIGKSTASRALVRRRAATLIEDGLVVVGEDAAGWKVVETGTYGVLHDAARISAVLRRLVPAPTSPNTGPGGAPSERQQFLVRRIIENLSFQWGVLLAGRPRIPMTPRLVPVARVELFPHPSPGFSSYWTDGRTFAPVGDFASAVPAGVALRPHSPIGPAREVRARLEAAVLGETADGPEPAAGGPAPPQGEAFGRPGGGARLRPGSP
jgi:hypothetical protein